MPTTDKRIDAYLAKSKDFARPVLTRLRELIHEFCPDCEETVKWSSPTFMYGGGILCGIVAFKERCVLHFWKGPLIVGEGQKDENWEKLNFLTKVSDIPPKKIVGAYIKKAMELNEAGAKVPKRPTTPKKELVIPDAFIAAIKKNKKALAAYEKFSPSHQREYIEWISGAKAEATRDRRIAQAVEWMAEGKPRNWKYM